MGEDIGNCSPILPFEICSVDSSEVAVFEDHYELMSYEKQSGLIKILLADCDIFEESVQVLIIFFSDF